MSTVHHTQSTEDELEASPWGEPIEVRVSRSTFERVRLGTEIVICSQNGRADYDFDVISKRSTDNGRHYLTGVIR